MHADLENKKIFISADHNGTELLKELIEFCTSCGHLVEEFPLGDQDYIDISKKITDAVVQTEGSFGILICGSGMGVTIAANRNPKVRAALCRTVEDAQTARRQNNANVLCIGSRYTTAYIAKKCLEAFLIEPFKSQNHSFCVGKLSSIC